jgi:hypothetical protein
VARRHQQDADNMRTNPTIRPGMENQPRDVIARQQQQRATDQERDAAMFRARAEQARRRADELREELRNAPRDP